MFILLSPFFVKRAFFLNVLKKSTFHTSKFFAKTVNELVTVANL